MTKRSLRDVCPKHTLTVPVALALSSGLLFAGLSLPLLHAQQMVFWKSSYSVWQGVVALYHQNEVMLAAIVFFFSIVFPIVKLIGLAVVWFWRLPEEQRTILLHWLVILGKWSMLDVFVVAILIVLVKLGPVAHIEPRSGVYVFACAIACSMLTTIYVERLARSSSK